MALENILRALSLNEPSESDTTENVKIVASSKETETPSGNSKETQDGEESVLCLSASDLNDDAEATRRKNFWSQFHIPFAFSVGIKPVRSGYSASSWGDGGNRATVYHIMLDEAFSNGRLMREKGEYLCSQPEWIPYSTISSYKGSFSPVISCKRCLKMMERWKIES